MSKKKTAAELKEEAKVTFKKRMEQAKKVEHEENTQYGKSLVQISKESKLTPEKLLQAMKEQFSAMSTAHKSGDAEKTTAGDSELPEKMKLPEDTL
jgi:translation initiation factor 1 (eIF-1/SUI1)